MRVASFSCLLLTAVAEAPANRSLLNGRRLADGRRLGDAKCEIEVWPGVNSFGKNDPYDEASNTRACPSGESVIVDNQADQVDDAGTEDEIKEACCDTAVKCSVSYVDNDADAGDGQTACTTANNKVPSDLYCLSLNAAKDACGSAVAAAVTADKAHCCRLMCNDEEGGFELFEGGDANLFDCPEDGTFRVHTTAYCDGTSCNAGDKTQCCQKKCTSGFVLDDVDKDTDAGNDQNCPEGADRVNPDKYCEGKTCDNSADKNTCCQNKCSDGYELFGGTTDGKLQCGENLRVSPDAFCSGPTCKASDDSTCCETKCDKAAAGFELNGGSTTGMSQCAKDLRVHPTEYCDGTDCGSSSGVCCQQKCTAGFKLKGATGTGTECAADLKVHATAYCAGSSCVAADAGTCCQQTCSKGWKLTGATTKEANTCAKDTTLNSEGKCTGSPCADTDKTICCNEKCTHKTTGFKVKGAAGKEPNECKAGEVVVSKERCKGDCSSDDASKCCQKTNMTASTDAKSSGLASLVAGLVVMAAAAAS